MEQHIPAPWGGWRWWPSAVSRILKSRVYRGYVEYRGIETIIPELAIIERAQWNAAQRQSKQNSFEADRNRQREYLLARQLRCACGQAMTAVTRVKKKRNKSESIYYCVTRGQPKELFPVACRCGSISSKKVDASVWLFVRQSLSDDQLRDGLQEADRGELRPALALAEQIKKIDADITAHEKQIEALLDRFGSETEHDHELAAMVELKIREVRQKIQGCRSQREELLAASDQRAELIEQRKDIYARLKRIRRKLDRAHFEMRRHVIDLLNVRVQLALHEDGRRFGYLMCLLFDKPQIVEFD